jgi:hypothetical protein
LALPTHGEGFGLTPLEAMACGAAVAVTDWGGSRDYLGNDTLRIALDGLESCADYWQCGGKWARPSVASLRYCLRWAFEHRAQCRRMAKAASKRVRQDWTWVRSALKIEALVSEVDPAERVAVEERDVVIWRGDPIKVTTRLGGFVRDIPRELTTEQVRRLNPADMGPKGFSVENRLRRRG